MGVGCSHKYEECGFEAAGYVYIVDVAPICGWSEEEMIVNCQHKFREHLLNYEPFLLKTASFVSALQE